MTLASAAASKHPEGANPNKDPRFDMLDATIKRQRFQPDSLIEILHTAQELFGHLRPDILYRVAHALKLPPSRVYGVATFYHLFSFSPEGKHTCVVCTGTACYVKGADVLMGALEKELGITAGKTTPDGEVSLSTARCLGACGLAPIVVYDGAVASHQNKTVAVEAVKKWKTNGS